MIVYRRTIGSRTPSLPNPVRSLSQFWERGNATGFALACSPAGRAALSIGRRLRTGWGMRAVLIRRDLAALQPGHHGAQLVADLFDLVLLGGPAHIVEGWTAVDVLGHPALGELAALDVLQHLVHRLPHPVVDDARPADIIAILGGVADRVAHVLHAALEHQVDDQLQL